MKTWQIIEERWKSKNIDEEDVITFAENDIKDLVDYIRQLESKQIQLNFNPRIWKFFGSIGWYNGSEWCLLKLQLFESFDDELLMIIGIQFLKLSFDIGWDGNQ